MSAPRNTTDATFDTDIPESGIAVVDFWATWCGPCRSFAPVFEQAAAANPDVVFLKVDVDANPALTQSFAIQSIPTLLFFKDSTIVGAVPGALSAAQFALALDQARRGHDGAVV